MMSDSRLVMCLVLVLYALLRKFMRDPKQSEEGAKRTGDMYMYVYEIAKLQREE